VSEHELTVEFVNPYYTATVRNYVAVQCPTGEIIRLWDGNGTLLAEEHEPLDRWPQYLAEAAIEAGYENVTEADIEQADTFESHEDLP
jgi:hypothetical protein